MAQEQKGIVDTKTVKVSEALWVRLKQRALDERMTLREVLERAAHQYLSHSSTSIGTTTSGLTATPMAAERTIEPDEFSQAPPRKGTR